MCRNTFWNVIVSDTCYCMELCRKIFMFFPCATMFPKIFPEDNSGRECWSQLFCSVGWLTTWVWILILFLNFYSRRSHALQKYSLIHFWLWLSGCIIISLAALRPSSWEVPLNPWTSSVIGVSLLFMADFKHTLWFMLRWLRVGASIVCAKKMTQDRGWPCQKGRPIIWGLELCITWYQPDPREWRRAEISVH